MLRRYNVEGAIRAFPKDLYEIVDKRIVVVDNNNFHKQEKGMSGGAGRAFLRQGRPKHP